MSESTDKCEHCKETFSLRVLRYDKDQSGKWVYLCSACRKALRDVQKD